MKIVYLIFATIILALVVLSAAGVAVAQDLKLLAVRGNVTSSAGAKMVAGQQLAVSDRITIASGGYVSVVHKNGRTLEIKKPSTVTVRDLQQRLTRPTSSASSKFASYVASELTEKNDPIAFRSKRRGNMKTTGSVERAAGDDVDAIDSALRIVGAPGEVQALAALSTSKIERDGRIAVVMPRSTRLLSDTVTFTWRRTPRWNSYRLIITDRANTVLVNKETTDTTVTLSLSALGVTSGELYSWHIEASTQPSERTPEYSLWVLNGRARADAESLLEDITSSQEDSQSAIAMLIRAAACEDLGLVYEAYLLYMRVVALEPEIDSYRRACAEFLVRHSLTIEAYSVYEPQ